MTYPTGYHMLLRDLNAEPRWADVANVDRGQGAAANDDGRGSEYEG